MLSDSYKNCETFDNNTLSNFEQIKQIIDNNIKYKLKHKKLPRIQKSQCSYFQNNGLINTNLFFNPNYPYYSILCILNGLKRVEDIEIYNFHKYDDINYHTLVKQYKILLISSLLKLNIIYTEKRGNTLFDGIIFNNKNMKLGLTYYICSISKIKNKFLFTDVELDIIKEYLNNGTNTKNYINKNIIFKKIPKELKHIFRDVKYSNSHKKIYINHLRVIHNNKKIMNEYYDKLINKTLLKFKKFVNSDIFNTKYRNNKKKIKVFDITKEKIFNEISFNKNSNKNKISKELDKIK